MLSVGVSTHHETDSDCSPGRCTDVTRLNVPSEVKQLLVSSSQSSQAAQYTISRNSNAIVYHHAIYAWLPHPLPPSENHYTSKLSQGTSSKLY